MLRLFVISFALLLLFNSACSPQQGPQRVVQLAPSSILQAQFGPCDCIAVATLQQLALYNSAGELQSLLNLPEASPYWQFAWLNPDQLVITNDKELYHWQPSVEALVGPWQAPSRIRRVAADAGWVALELSNQRLQTFAFSANGLEFEQIHRLEGTLASLAISSNSGLVAASQNGALQFWRWPQQGAFSNEPEWQVNQLEPPVTRALNLHDEHLWLIAQTEGDHFARGSGQQLVKIDIANGTQLHRERIDLNGQAASLLLSADYGWVGSSENCIQGFLVNEQPLGVSAPYCYPKPQRFGRQSGQVVALKATNDQLLAITTSGYLQIWQKRVIVSSLYGSKH